MSSKAQLSKKCTEEIAKLAASKENDDWFPILLSEWDTRTLLNWSMHMRKELEKRV